MYSVYACIVDNNNNNNNNVNPLESLESVGSRDLMLLSPFFAFVEDFASSPT